jgi:hypothetical protein
LLRRAGGRRGGGTTLKNKKMEEEGWRVRQLEKKENNLILGLLFLS